MRNTGITLIYVDGDRTPRPVDSQQLIADTGAMHRNIVHESGPHARTFLTPSGQNVTIFWSHNKATGSVHQLFIDTRGLNTTDPALTGKRKASH